MTRMVLGRLVGVVLAAGLLAGVACSSSPSSASVSAGLSADVSLIQAAVSSGDRRTAIDLLHRLDTSVQGLAQMGSLAPSRAAEIHTAISDVLNALHRSRSAAASTPTASPTIPASTITPSPSGDETGPPPDHGHGKPPKDEKPPKGEGKPPKD